MKPFVLWAVDPLIKVFQDDLPGRNAENSCEVYAARNEYEAAQFALRSEQPLTNLRACVEGHRDATVDFVGHVPVRNNTPNTPPPEFVRRAPAMFPDPMLGPEMDRLEANTTLPIWSTLWIPRRKKPGTYKLRLIVKCDQGTLERPFMLRVANATVPDKRNLCVTNWFSGQAPEGGASLPALASSLGTSNYSKKHWDGLRAFARMMREHRQNAALTPVFNLIEFKAGKGGRLAFGFKRFDQWVRLFIEEGVIGLIEGSHLAGRKVWMAKEFDVRVRLVRRGKVVSDSAPPDDPKVEEFFSQFFPALERHLKKRGWLDQYIQHVADEPVEASVESYRKLGALVKKYAPNIRRVDANHHTGVVGGIDIWVPQLNFYDLDYDFYRDRQKAGDEVWFYTCLAPTGTYPNRLIDYSLLKVRLLHWINFRYGATGYLHWGWNNWKYADPFKDTELPLDANTTLPAGDRFIVYPSAERHVLSSIRQEAMRDGIEDYELLRLLEKKSPEKAHSIARRMVPQMHKPQKSVAKFRQARRELLDALGK